MTSPADKAYILSLKFLAAVACLIICVLAWVLFGYELYNFDKIVYDPSGMPIAGTSRGLIGTMQDSSDTGILAADWIITIISVVVGLAAAGIAILFVFDDGE